MLEADAQPARGAIEEPASGPQVCTLVVGGRLLGVDLDLVRELRPNPDTQEIDVVLRIDDDVVMLGVDEVGEPLELDQIEGAGVEMISPAQLLGR